MHVYFDEQKQQEIEVPLERWVWAVIYGDGTEFHQFDDKGRFHRVGEIDQDRMVMFVLRNDTGKRIDIPWRPGMKLVYKYRMLKPGAYDSKDANEDGFVRIYMLGWKYEGAHAFYFILPDDRVVASPVDDIDLTLFNI